MAIISAVFSILPLPAATVTDSVSVYFPIGQSAYDETYGDNGASMSGFIERLTTASSPIESVVVRGYVSPDGHSIGDRLAQRRCDDIARYITRRSGIDPATVKAEYAGIDWPLLRQYITESADLPYSEKIIDIIDNVPVWIYDTRGNIVDGRNKRMMDLAGGRPYRRMRETIFPRLRKAVVVVTYGPQPAPAVCPEPVVPPAASETAIVTIAEDTGYTEVDMDTAVTDIAVTDSVIATSDSVPPYAVADSTVSDKARGLFMAVKTNMLYDTGLVPNLAAEFYVGKNLSVFGEWMYAWWDSYNRHRYWRIYGGDIGLRWWFGAKAHEKPLTGHHLGIFAGVLTFDFELGDYGYMGGKPGGTLWDRCMVNSGIEYGYSLPVGSRLNIDFSIALGYMGGNYIKYFPFDNEYYRDKEYKMRYFGPTKAEISLVWLIGPGNVNKKKGGDR